MTDLKDMTESNSPFSFMPASYHKVSDSECGMIKEIATGKVFLAASGSLSNLFSGREIGGFTCCPLTFENAKVLMRLFPHTAPVRLKGKGITMGFGDRLGCAGPGHIRAAAAHGIFPVLAQQSIRELTLTGRTFGDVLAAAAFSVFREGYTEGYGADGDHLKTKEEIKTALDAGYTMITLDCSAQIGAGVAEYDSNQLKSAYASLPADIRSHYEQRYIGKNLPVVGTISIDQLAFIVLTFHKAMEHAKECYQYIRDSGKQVDFELSIDETLCSTDPAAHFVIANELLSAGVELFSIAPHFCGQFEKGIDYIGNVSDFAKEFAMHQQIAEHFGSYKLSVHSGSDKFAVMPTIGKVAKGNFHLKTAGTSWLEAMRVLAEKNPSLYRRAHRFALEHQAEARAYYHISSDPLSIVPIDLQNDAYLPEYMNDVSARQAIHISYGILLSQPWFKEEFSEFLQLHDEAYSGAIEKHMNRHISLLSD